MTKEEFIHEMVNAYKSYGKNMAKSYCKSLLDDFLDGEGATYGDDGYNWSKDGAIELVECDMSYWGN